MNDISKNQAITWYFKEILVEDVSNIFEPPCNNVQIETLHRYSISNHESSHSLFMKFENQKHI